MNIDTCQPVSPEQFSALLLKAKYLDLIRKIAKGSTHSYNNIFTGLTGQIVARSHDASRTSAQADRRQVLIDDLLARGIQQTELLSEIARPADKDSRIHSSALIGSKVVALLDCISRLHRFRLDMQANRSKIFGNVRKIILALCYLGEQCIDNHLEGGEIVLVIALDSTVPDNLLFSFRYSHPVPSRQCFQRQPDSTEYEFPQIDTRPFGVYAAETLVREFGGSISHQATHPEILTYAASFPVVAEVVAKNVPVYSKQDQPAIEEEKQCFLVVDDDEAIRQLLLSRLQRRGHMVFCVGSCREALDEYSQLSDIITIILMDIGLRDGTGYECWEKLQTINPQVKLIFMSGSCEDEEKGSGQSAVFLQKPFTMDQLEEAVNNVQV